MIRPPMTGETTPAPAPDTAARDGDGNGTASPGGPAPAGPGPVAPASRSERMVTIGAAAVCVVVALLVGRSCGAAGVQGGSPGATTSASPVDPAAARVSAGLAATDPNAAVQHFREALQLHPGHYGATFQLARALDRAGRKDEAQQQWQRVLQMAEQARDQPLVEMARARLAQADPMTLGLDALYTKRDPAAAAARFREVLAQNPEHYGATFQLATALDQAGDLRAAQPVWQKMLAMAEATQDGKTADTARARLAEIDKVLGAPAANDPDAEAMRDAVSTLYTKRDPAAAAVQLRKILARTPEHYGATFQLATALDQAGKPAEARPLWEKMLVLAEAAGDTKTAEAARARLAKKP